MSAIANFPLQLPTELKDAVAQQASAAGVSMNQFIAAAIAARVGALAEAERYFAIRVKRAVPGRAKVVLKRADKGRKPRPGDGLRQD